MDQEKFDQHLMGYLFDELDEVTSAAMKRKIESDAQCRETEAGLRATIEVGQLPLEEPSDDLEERIMAAAAVAQQGEPMFAKVVRMLSWAGSHAMRPQLAMAALLCLVVGSSILLLRAKPGSVAVSPDSAVSDAAPATPAEAFPEQPAAEPPALAQAEEAAEADQAQASATAEALAAAPAASASAAEEQALASLDERFDRAMKNYRAGKFRDAQDDFNAVSGSAAHPKAASAALYEAKAVRSHSGCKAAVRYYDAVRQRHRGTRAAVDAAWGQADCHAALGETGKAKQIWASLTGDEDYGKRAAHELANRGEAGSSGKNAVSAPRKRAASQPYSGGSGKGAKAAPRAPAPKAAPPVSADAL